MKKTSFISILVAFIAIIIFNACQSGGSSDSDSDSTQPPASETTITDVSTDADGITSGSTTLPTGEKITVSASSEESVKSVKITQDSSMDYNEESYEPVRSGSLKVDSKDRVSVEIKFNETPNAVMAKNELGEIYYTPFINKNGSSYFRIESGKTSLFPIKLKSSNSQSFSTRALSSASSSNVIRRISIERDGNNLCVRVLDPSLNINRAELDGETYSNEAIVSQNISNNYFAFMRLKNQTYVVKLFERKTDKVVWEQNIFIENQIISKYIIMNLVKKFAPVLLMNKKESFFPTSLENIFQNININTPPNFNFEIASIDGDGEIPYKNLVEFLSTNGHNKAFHNITGEVKDFLKEISGNSDKTVYHSFICKDENCYLNFHFLYSYDSKGTKEKLGIGNHGFDRESITLVFTNPTDKSTADNFEEPYGIVFGAHLQGQTIKYNGETKVTWKGGRVYVPWQSAKKSGNHPIVPVALGSHALYPLCGIYTVLGIDETICGSDLDSTKFLLPENIYNGSFGDSYKLSDLRIDTLNSYSKDSHKALIFSGGLIDMLSGSEKFPPFTDRMIKIKDWTNYIEDGNIAEPDDEEFAFYWDISGSNSPLTDGIANYINNSLTPLGSGKIPDTGQTIYYTDTFGEDSDYTINPPSYTDNGDGTITDNITGLIWQQEDDNIEKWGYEWSIKEYCSELSLGGYNDWKLPTLRELNSIVNYATNPPSINSLIFPDTNPLHYWSSDINPLSNNSRGYVIFEYGNIGFYSMGSLHHIRCVRSNQESTLWPFNFLIIKNGIVLHQSTGLIWQQEDDHIAKTWENALSYCRDLILGEYDDWRLPNIRELHTIVNYSVNSPTINTEYFLNTNPSNYWSSTTYVNDPKKAWKIAFNMGILNNYNKDSAFNTRCVR
ncbi:MAG: DUF1566 domain-containing protein [Candidatus Pacearchaeota archaeon]|nr:DUF1566 domain-containing protein [Candidatus Pacearchaeota archaeon]